jgi:hypothetical protein
MRPQTRQASHNHHESTAFGILQTKESMGFERYLLVPLSKKQETHVPHLKEFRRQ